MAARIKPARAGETAGETAGRQVLKPLHDRLAAFDSIRGKAIKCRNIPYESHLVSGQEGRSFAALTITLIAGRPPELRQQIIDGLNQVLLDWAKESAVSVRLVEVAKEDYRTYNP